MAPQILITEDHQRYWDTSSSPRNLSLEGTRCDCFVLAHDQDTPLRFALSARPHEDYRMYRISTTPPNVVSDNRRAVILTVLHHTAVPRMIYSTPVVASTSMRYSMSCLLTPKKGKCLPPHILLNNSSITSHLFSTMFANSLLILLPIKKMSPVSFPISQIFRTAIAILSISIDLLSASISCVLHTFCCTDTLSLVNVLVVLPAKILLCILGPLCQLHLLPNWTQARQIIFFVEAISLPSPKGLYIFFRRPDLEQESPQLDDQAGLGRRL